MKSSRLSVAGAYDSAHWCGAWIRFAPAAFHDLHGTLESPREVGDVRIRQAVLHDGFAIASDLDLTRSMIPDEPRDGRSRPQLLHAVEMASAPAPWRQAHIRPPRGLRSTSLVIKSLSQGEGRTAEPEVLPDRVEAAPPMCLNTTCHEDEFRQ